MDSGIYYALLRFEEAALALRTVFRIEFIERMGDDELELEGVRQRFEWTEQAARTFLPLLHCMHIVDARDASGGPLSVPDAGLYRCSDLAKVSLGKDSASRRPYLSMGMPSEVDELARLLQGESDDASLPLYESNDAAPSLMDNHDLGEEIAIGLSSRAKQFAKPLAAAFREHADARVQTVADLGAGSPYFAIECLRENRFDEVLVIDRENGLVHIRTMLSQQSLDASTNDRIKLVSQNFFDGLPKAEAYNLSNTAHDWLPRQYADLLERIRKEIPPHGLLCLHEPLLKTNWQTETEWIESLWMSCYALTLFKLTQGLGSCYTLAEHDAIADANGFHRDAKPVRTVDGCTALFYTPK